MFWIYVRVGIFKSGLCALICLNLLNKGTGPKVIVPTVLEYFEKKCTFFFFK